MKSFSPRKIGVWMTSVVVAVALLASACGAQKNNGNTILWSDEFDTDGAPNPRVWGYDTGNWGWGNIEYQNYTDRRENSFVQDGNLHVVALRNTNDQTFSSARLKTDEKVFMQYGTVQARIKIPNVQNGLWPAFWTLGQDFKEVDWPASGEIDIMEIGDGWSLSLGEGNRRVISAVHLQRPDGTYFYNYTWSEARPVDLSKDYHIYTLDWTPDRISMFVDDYMTHTFEIGSKTCAGCEELHQPHYFIFNLAVGGKYNIQPGDDPYDQSRVTATLPATMLVDYIRILDNGFAQVSGPGTTASTADDETEPVNPPPSPPPPPPTAKPVLPPTPQPASSNVVTPPRTPLTAAPLQATRPKITASPTVESSTESPTFEPTTAFPTTLSPTSSPSTAPATGMPTTSPSTLTPTAGSLETLPPTILNVTAPPTAMPTTTANTSTPTWSPTTSPWPTTSAWPTETNNNTVNVGPPVSSLSSIVPSASPSVSMAPTPELAVPTPSPTLDPLSEGNDSLVEASAAANTMDSRVALCVSSLTLALSLLLIGATV